MKRWKELIIREAKEEAGVDILELKQIYRYWSSPGAYAERVNLFCARVDATKAGGVHGLESEGEDIRVHAVDSKEAFQMLHSGMDK